MGLEELARVRGPVGTKFFRHPAAAATAASSIQLVLLKGYVCGKTGFVQGFWLFVVVIGLTSA